VNRPGLFSNIAERDRAAADRLIEAIEACAERLPKHPHMYRPGRISGTREAVVHPNYILIYRVTAESVNVPGASAVSVGGREMRAAYAQGWVVSG
jgi:toxin ParE1/3/4